MAYRDKLTQRGNVEDRRGNKSSGGGIGGVGITGIVAILAIGYFAGPEAALQVYDVLQGQQPTLSQEVDFNSIYEGEDEYETFVSTVVGSANEIRSQAFAANDLRYQEPRLVLFRGATQSACGGAVSQSGPHYCPADQTIYLDETFFEELERRLGAQGGDVAEAYVIAHEVGHHVQNLLGTLDKTLGGDNQASINTELQADCFAGIRANTIRQAGVLETPDEIYEAMDAAAAVGDDSIQRRTTGTVSPETRTHGSSAQRKQRFAIGYDTGDIGECNTFG